MLILNVRAVNEKPTNALLIRCVSTQYSPTCFGILGRHHQGDICDTTEMCAQYRRKQRKMGAVYCTRCDCPVIIVYRMINVFVSFSFTSRKCMVQNEKTGYSY
jgi:hypothetical protein